MEFVACKMSFGRARGTNSSDISYLKFTLYFFLFFLWVHFLLFHQVDDKKTVGREAFARIAPVCAAVADIITVHNLFDALTSSSGHRLHFLVYDKYLRSLDKYALLFSINFVNCNAFFFLTIVPSHLK